MTISGTRILILGPSGAGKSTLARELGQLLGYPVIHLDAHFWQPGWVHLPRDVWRVQQEALLQGDRWIVDGNYGSTLDLRLQYADCAIFLDYPRFHCLYRALKRRIQYRGTTRPDMPPDCPEKIDLEFIRWILWDFPQKERKPALEQCTRTGIPLLRCKRNADAKSILRDAAAVRR